MPRLLLTTAVRFCALVLLLLGIAPPLRAQAADSVAVLTVVERLFDAMAQRDTAAARGLLVPGSRFVSVRGDSAGAGPRVASDTAFLRSLAAGRARLRERIWSPTVQLRGPLATVWAPYDFHVDGQRTHCGVDAFTLIRADAVWKIAGIAYTVVRRTCTASPLGPPQ
jgi:hypothetical protein